MSGRQSATYEGSRTNLGSCLVCYIQNRKMHTALPRPQHSRLLWLLPHSRRCTDVPRIAQRWVPTHLHMCRVWDIGHDHMGYRISGMTCDHDAWGTS